MVEDGIVSTLRLRWRFFWSRRSRRRTLGALASALLALLAIIYLALPSSGQTQVIDGLRSVIQGMASLGFGTMLAGGVAICFLLSLILIFAPSYRRHGYLVTAPSIIPPVSVYLDAENQLTEKAIRPFTAFLMKHLDGRRADFLYFLDASQTARTEKYKELYRFGFRPVDVPHDPMGYARVKEAVDKELAMHAYERALLGPRQEFIIVTGDQDFVSLVYRLVALGHSVQIWATPIRPAYRVLAKYLNVNVLDLTNVVAELQTEANEADASSRAKGEEVEYADTKAFSPLQASPAEEQLYLAIVETLSVHASTGNMKRLRSDESRADRLRSLLSSKLAPRMASVGYSAGKWQDYWIEHLCALQVFKLAKGRSFPARGMATPAAAAHSMYSMAQMAAGAAIENVKSSNDGTVHMSGVAAALASMTTDSASTENALLKLVLPNNGKRATHMRYFVRSARALGLLEFEDLPDLPDRIAHPRLAVAPLMSQDTESVSNLPDSVSDQPSPDQDEIHMTLSPVETNQAASSESEAMIVPLVDMHEQIETELP